MKFPNFLKFTAFTLLLVCTALSMNAFSQAQDPQVVNENVLEDSLVIPMDNVNQGNGAGTTFNLRAYGLVNRLLQNNIPVKWAIKYGKTKDVVDFSASVTRIAGNDGPASGNVSFSGGPFIVAPEYLALAQVQITAFNNLIGGTADDVTVYRVTNSNSFADIRYTITHKPLLAIGPDGGNFGTGVYQDLLDAAGIPNYTSVTDQSMQPTSCYTMAMQAHSTSSPWVSSYKGFVLNGGNLFLECASINTFENNALNGHFQTTNGWTVFGTNTNNDVSGTPFYPNGYMPFSQFIGNLNGNQDGAITDYQLAGGSALQNGTLAAARHGTSQNPGVYIATVSKVANVGRPGGYVFELGGHDYTRGTASDITNINGRRMILNAIFVPVTRPCSQLSQPAVEGYKSVHITTDVPPAGLSMGDTVEWDIDYINRSLAPALNFQINDPIQSGMVYVAGSLTVSATGALTTATANAAYNGVSDTQMLAAAPPSNLFVNGTIHVTFKTIVTPPAATFQNQATATGFNVPSSGILTDSLDVQDGPVVYPGGNVVAPAGSIDQGAFQTNNLDPTVISYLAPTAAPASITGRVSSPEGVGLRGVIVTVINVSTGEIRTATTNSFGYYTVTDLEVGNFYRMTVSSKKYLFRAPIKSFTLGGDLFDIDFVSNE